MKKDLLCALFLLALCTPFKALAQMPVIFETDMGNDIDDAWALDMLYKYADEGKVDLMAVMLNKPGEGPLHYVDVMNTWYGYPRVPIARCVSQKVKLSTKARYTDVVPNYLYDNGQRIYKRSVKDYTRLPDAVTLYRKLLSKANDGSVTIISVGFSTNLSALLASGSDKYSKMDGKQLVSRKVKRLIVMAGHMENDKVAEYNVVNDIPACQHVFAEWPTPIVVSAAELGANVKFPEQSFREDFRWTAHHPALDAVEVYLSKLCDYPTWDMTCVLYALEGEADFFTLSQPGTIRITDEGYSLYTAEPNGKHTYLITDEAQRKRIMDAMLELVKRQPKNGLQAPPATN